MGGTIQAKSFSSSLNVYTPVFVFHVSMTLFVSWLVFHIPETSLEAMVTNILHSFWIVLVLACGLVTASHFRSVVTGTMGRKQMLTNSRNQEPLLGF